MSCTTTYANTTRLQTTAPFKNNYIWKYFGYRRTATRDNTSHSSLWNADMPSFLGVTSPPCNYPFHVTARYELLALLLLIHFLWDVYQIWNNCFYWFWRCTRGYAKFSGDHCDLHRLCTFQKCYTSLSSEGPSQSGVPNLNLIRLSFSVTMCKLDKLTIKGLANLNFEV